MKCKCGGEIFTLNVEVDCEDCPYNGVYVEHLGYTYKDLQFPEDYVRDQSYEEGECKLGTSYDCGCYQFTCINCGLVTHLPVMEE